MRIVITGGNSGIGREAALHLARAGHQVVATSRSMERAAKLLEIAGGEGIDVSVVELDVSSDESVAAGFEQIHADHGPVDALVNNAGVGSNATLEDAAMDEWHSVFETNVFGPVRCAQAVLPSMRERGAGRICMVSSVIGRVAGIGQSVYTASKWAMEGYSESLALEVSRFGIKVSIVEPGVTRTAMLAKNHAFPDTAYSESYTRALAMYASLIPTAPGGDLTARVIEDAITSDENRLRWHSGDDADQLVGGRQKMTEADLLDMAHADDAEYQRLFLQNFDIDLSTGWPA